jgi:hypothetical protein
MADTFVSDIGRFHILHEFFTRPTTEIRRGLNNLRKRATGLSPVALIDLMGNLIPVSCQSFRVQLIRWGWHCFILPRKE